MEKEVWDTDNWKPWQIDQLIEVVRRYCEEGCKNGPIVEEEERYITIVDILCDHWEKGKMTEEQFRTLEGEDE